MAKRTFKAGATSQTIDVFIQDASSAQGAGLSGLVFNSSSLAAYYRKGATGTPTAITLATQTVGGAWSSGGFVELDATHMKGLYRLDVPDTVFASSPWAIVYLYGATNMAPVIAELEIVAYDPFDGTRLGLTALPNVAAGASGGLPLSVDASGRVDVLKVNGTSQTAGDIYAKVSGLTFTGAGKVDASVRDWVGDTIPARSVTGVPKVDVADWLGTAVTAAASGVPDVNAKNLGGTAQTGRDIGASVLLSPGTGTGQLDFTSGVVKANLAQILGTALTETSGLIAAAFKKFFNVATPTGTVNSIPDAVAGAAGGLFIAGSNAATTVNITGDITGNLSGSVGSVTARVTANADQLAGQTITAAAGVTFPASVASPTNITAGTITTVTNLTNAPTSGDLTATMKTSVTTAATAATPTAAAVTGNVGGNVVGSVGSVTAGVTLAASAVQSIWDALTSALTTVGSIGKLLVTNIDAAISSRLASGSYTAPDNSSITAIKAKTDSLTFTVSGLADANVVDWKGATAPAMTGDAYARIGAPVGASISADIAGVPASVWTVSTRLLTAGTNIVLAKGTGVTGLNDLDAAGVRGAVGLTSANLDTQLDAIPGLVWDVALTPHIATDTAALYLNAAGTAGDPWLTALPGSYASGTAGNILGNVASTDDVRDAILADSTPFNGADIAAIKTQTDLLPADPAATSDIPSAAIAAIKAKTDSLTFTVAGQVDSNIQSVNETAVTGSGTTGDPWGP